MTRPIDPPGYRRDRPSRPLGRKEQEMFERAMKGRSFTEMFTPEQWEMILSEDWPSALAGPPPPPPMKRRPRRRGEPPREG